jgi:hypothetical protein
MIEWHGDALVSKRAATQDDDNNGANGEWEVERVVSVALRENAMRGKVSKCHTLHITSHHITSHHITSHHITSGATQGLVDLQTARQCLQPCPGSLSVLHSFQCTFLLGRTHVSFPCLDSNCSHAIDGWMMPVLEQLTNKQLLGFSPPS